jgi:hypothetical protein
MKIETLRGFWISFNDNAVDAAFRMAFHARVLTEAIALTAAEGIQGDKALYQMTNSDQTHPLGDEETDQINPAVAEELAPAQLDWLCAQADVVGRKKLQILRQALFEWVGEHLEYRFNEARFGDTVRRALQEFMDRHSADVLEAETESPLVPGDAKIGEVADHSN